MVFAVIGDITPHALCFRNEIPPGASLPTLRTLLCAREIFPAGGGTEYSLGGMGSAVQIRLASGARDDSVNIPSISGSNAFS